MIRSLPRSHALGTSLLLGLLLAPPMVQAQQRTGRAFTPEDALDVRTARIQDVSDDGAWVAATVQRHRDRLNVDHERFGDPTYVSPSLNEVLVVSTRTGEERSLFDNPVVARAFSWSPDGSRLAFFAHVDGAFRLMLYDVGGGRLRTVDLHANLEIASNSPLEWRPDDGAVLIGLRPKAWAEESRRAYLALTEGPIVVQDSENDFLAWDAVRKRSADMITAIVTLSDGAVREIVPEAPVQQPQFSEDGSFVTYMVATRLRTSYERAKGTEYEIFQLDLSGEEPRSVHPATEVRLRPVWSEAGDAFAYDDDGSVFVRHLSADSVVNLTEEHRTPLAEDDTTKMRFTAMRWRPDGDALLVSSQKGYHLLDAESGDLEMVYEFEGEEDERPRLALQSWSENGRYLYLSYSAPDHWERGLVRYDLQDRLMQDLVKDESLYRSWNVSKDGSTIVYARSDGDRPDELWVADGSMADPRQLTDLNPQLHGVQLTRSELVEYLDVDGEKLYGILYYPIDYEPGKKYPLVAEIYETFFDNGYNANMNLLASRGWFGFRPSVDLEIGYPGEAWLKGVTTAINKVIDRGLVDEDKLGVHGTSYGGYATNLLITQTDRFAAAVNISGKVNIISFLGDSEKITTRNYNAAEEGQDRIGATLWEQPHKYVEHSAIMFADRINTPLLMLSGEGDWNVPATNQREMYYALRRLGKKVTWVNYMRAGHGAGRAGTVEDFLDHWNRMFEWYGTYFEEEHEAEVTTDGGSAQGGSSARSGGGSRRHRVVLLPIR